MDFRVSFAKNKTHSYALYTLAIKNIYGALPKEFKLKAYHCDIGDIYKSTMDYIKTFSNTFWVRRRSDRRRWSVWYVCRPISTINYDYYWWGRTL